MERRTGEEPENCRSQSATEKKMQALKICVFFYEGVDLEWIFIVHFLVY